MLRFAKGAAPKVLTGWQGTPGADWDSLPAADKDDVRDALLRDQGHLCAYCQRRIPARDDRMKIEHWLAQSGGRDKLRWINLLGVCLGDERAEAGSPAGEQHCDTARGDAPLFLHPVEGQGPSAVDYLVYSSEGEVRPSDVPQKHRVQGDIVALNMNAVRLRRARTAAYEQIRKRLDKRGWTRKTLLDEYRAARIEPGVQALPQCEVLRYHLRRWARQYAWTLEP